VFLVGQPEEGFLARRFVSAWPLLDEVTRIDRNTLVARRTFSLKRDPWLGEHRVDGDPVLPGTFELEMAAEAACALDGAPQRPRVRRYPLRSLRETVRRATDGGGRAGPNAALTAPSKSSSPPTCLTAAGAYSCGRDGISPP
jgi:acyl transferase domain-containing protein